MLCNAVTASGSMAGFAGADFASDDGAAAINDITAAETAVRSLLICTSGLAPR
jgi:hypothetical protein